MNSTVYEIVEENMGAQIKILSGLGEHPIQGIAYLLMMASGPMSASDITGFLSLSDAWFIGKFDTAVQELAQKGLIAALQDEYFPQDSWPDAEDAQVLLNH